MCFPELAEDESGEFDLFCGLVHSFIAMFLFVAWDYMCNIGAFFLYWLDYEALVDHSSGKEKFLALCPIIALVISILSHSLGVWSIHRRDAWSTTLYLRRIELIVVFSIIWIIVSMFFRFGRNFLEIPMWFLAVFIYTFGIYVVSETVKFHEYSYRGFDDADPEIEEKWLKKMGKWKVGKKDSQEDEDAGYFEKATNNLKKAWASWNKPRPDKKKKPGDKESGKESDAPESVVAEAPGASKMGAAGAPAAAGEAPTPSKMAAAGGTPEAPAAAGAPTPSQAGKAPSAVQPPPAA